MGVKESYMELKNFAKQQISNLNKGIMHFGNDERERLAKLYEEYLNQLPPENREMWIGYVGFMVKRSEVPSLIRKDPEFAIKLMKRLAEV
ncbi:hypothetical protein [Candidatus Methanodesulfokora washburnensis]|jgi:hypothetical protein|uniref:Uncharacterized protein n=1 Tax=Candidatus Methanodesulfokora washburnensis TaxID=2478471 RepID=A0A3R9QCR5_9CREN|nr:hypothetical protein [Candidatus Methanodesulfokores washburnensis]RSN73368.1 hypothetical protein D6D85_10650 [Candidatus Methanodesulfokores washburnensis]